MSLVAKKLEKKYGSRQVVKGISLEVSPGQIVGLLGPNGAGKTTTFYMIVGLVQADAGTVTMNGINLTKMAMYQRARSGIGYLSQEPSIFRQLSVEDNLRAILEHQPGSKSDKETRIDVLLEEFGLTKLRKQMAVTLSGGEKRRCEIARALTTNPEILLLDEPFVGIDPITVADIQSMLQALKKRGLGILISDHNVQATLEIVDRASIVYDGGILTEGSSEKLLTDPEARRVYLGEKFKI
ncbi:MAG: Lipopolysaccharide export system ATP-binding protein LptB [Elusimicrobia bacterium]|nr:Lipopolysaccharide export system ATP-binding protein LptB [Elusimicrobiota bacterium]